MKEDLLKSVASPMTLFFAPFRLVIFNAVFSVLMMAVMLLFDATRGYSWIGIAFFVIMHGALIALGKWEPHIDNIIFAKFKVGFTTKSMVEEPGDKFSP